ncbi:MAG: malic enzyme-like NAD(P)-binding protein [Candidatus Micrarchaeota archaeon]
MGGYEQQLRSKTKLNASEKNFLLQRATSLMQMKGGIFNFGRPELLLNGSDQFLHLKGSVVDNAIALLKEKMADPAMTDAQRAKAENLLKNEKRLREVMELHLYGPNSVGPVSVVLNVTVTNQNRPLVYTPGIADLCTFCELMPEMANLFTIGGRTVGVTSDGTRILGLGDIGAVGAKPLVGGKSALFMDGSSGKTMSFPLVINEKVDMEGDFKKWFDENVLAGADEKFKKEVDNWEKIVLVNAATAHSFAFINLEDYESTNGKCFYILRRLQEVLKKEGVGVWHDDNQGTGTMATAAVLNALKAVGKDIKDAKIVMNGVGGANVGIFEYLVLSGAKPENIIMADINGVLYEGRPDTQTPQGWYLKELAQKTNPEKLKGKNINDVIAGADVLISATGPEAVKKTVSTETIEKMAEKPIVFILENPTPRDLLDELTTKVNERGGVIANGSFPPNQANNMYVFPGLMWGAVETYAKEINNDMVSSLIGALAGRVGDRLGRDFILPEINPEMHFAIASAVADAAIKSGAARVSKNIFKDPEYQRSVLGYELKQ